MSSIFLGNLLCGIIKNFRIERGTIIQTQYPVTDFIPDADVRTPRSIINTQASVMEYYDKSGQLNTKGNFKDGELDGLWEYFNEDGSLKKTETWKNGVKQE